MARLLTSGIDKVEEELYKLEGNIEPLAKAMVMQGAELMKQQRITTAIAYGHVRNHDMIDNIGYAKNPRSVGGVIRNDVFSRGVDEKGVRNAEKEFLLHYGWSNYDGDHWVDEADKLGSEIVYDKLSAMMDQFVKTGNVPNVQVSKRRK